MTDTTTPTLTVNEKVFAIDSLPQEIKDLIGIYKNWEEEKISAQDKVKYAQIEVFKLDAALKALGAEIETRVNNMSEPSASVPAN